MFQWTFSQFWPLGLHSNQLKLWNVTSGWKPRGKALLFPPTTMSDFIKGLWRREGAVGLVMWERRTAGFSPASAWVHTPWPTSSMSPLSAEARKTWTSIKQQWLSYLFSVFAEPQPQHNQEGLSWKAGMQIKQRYQRFAPTFLGTREGLFPTIFAKNKNKKVRIYSCGEKKKEEWRVGGIIKSSWGFFNSKFYRGAKVTFTR